MARPRPPTLAPAAPEQAADEAADRDAIAAERPLPAQGTVERERLDSPSARPWPGCCWALSGTGSAAPQCGEADRMTVSAARFADGRELVGLPADGAGLACSKPPVHATD